MKSLFFAVGMAFSIFSTSSVYAQSSKETGVQTISLLGDKLFPEGILTLPDNTILVGGFGDGSIQKINSNNEVSYLSKAGENGMVIAVGMNYDKERNRLWVANFNFQTESGKPGSNMKLFDLKTGKLLKTIPEKFIEGVFFNEVTVDQSGRVYVSNTFGPEIWTISAEENKAEVFVQNKALLSNPSPEQPFGLNGLTITPDNKYLLTSVMDRFDAGEGTLVKINLASKEVSAVKLSGDKAVKAFAGSDGMFFYKNQLIMVNVFSAAGAIITASFNEDYSEASLQIRDRFQSVYDRPTASAIRKGILYTVNSQLNHIIDDKDGQLNTPPETPFKVVGVPLNELLK